MKKCPACEQELSNNEKFCPKCGASTETAAEQPIKEDDIAKEQETKPILEEETFSQEAAVLEHKISMAKMKAIFATILIIVSFSALLTPIIKDDTNLSEVQGAYDNAVAISSIESVGGKTLEEAYYQAYGVYLYDEALVNEFTVLTVKRIYSFICLTALLSGVYLLLTSVRKRKLLENIQKHMTI